MNKPQLLARQEQTKIKVQLTYVQDSSQNFLLLMSVARQQGLSETIDSVLGPVTTELTVEDQTKTTPAKHTKKIPTKNRELAMRQSVGWLDLIQNQSGTVAETKKPEAEPTC